MSSFKETTANFSACDDDATICTGANCLVPNIDLNAKLNLALSIVFTVMQAMIMLAMGCSLNAHKLWGHLRRPWGIAVGFLCQFGIMPFTACALSFAFNVLPVQAIAINILGCCPGGAISNIICRLLEGDMDLSITMTACSTTLSMGMMPLCLLIYTSIWTSSDPIQIPYDTIGVTLVAFLVPVTVGMCIKHRWPHYAKRILKVGSIAGVVFLVIISVVGMILYESSWIIDPYLWIIGTIYPFIGFGMGFLLAYFVGQPWHRCRTIAVETGIQNSLLCNTIIQLSFGPAEKEAMFAFPIIYSIFQLMASVLFVGGYQTYKRSNCLQPAEIESQFPSLEGAVDKLLLSPTLDPHQFAYRANRSTDDTINIALHNALGHLENRGTYLSTGSPQRCVQSPLIFTLYTSDCSPTHISNKIVKFADSTTLVGLISGGDEVAYGEEVERLAVWCSENNLLLNTTKTKEVILDFRKKGTHPAPLAINGECVERVNSFKLLGVHISDDLSWSANARAVVERAQQRLHFLGVLKKNHLEQKLLVSFYRATVESILTYCITVWYAGCTEADRRSLQKVINTAQKIIGCSLPSLEDIASSCYQKRANNIMKDRSHPGHPLCDLLPSGKHYRSHKTRTNRLRDS
nr:ileal sodium/bile acid cotransporter-like [Nerophis lumbriciformis]